MHGLGQHPQENWRSLDMWFHDVRKRTDRQKDMLIATLRASAGVR